MEKLLCLSLMLNQLALLRTRPEETEAVSCINVHPQSSIFALGHFRGTLHTSSLPFKKKKKRVQRQSVYSQTICRKTRHSLHKQDHTLWQFGRGSELDTKCCAVPVTIFQAVALWRQCEMMLFTLTTLWYRLSLSECSSSVILIAVSKALLPLLSLASDQTWLLWLGGRSK